VAKFFGGLKMDTLTKIHISIFCIVFSLIFTLFTAIAENNKPIMSEEELYQKCKSCFTTKDYNGASQNIKEFVSSYPKSDYTAEVLYMQAFVQQDANTAVGMYKNIISKYPSSAWVAKSHFQLGQCYYLQGKYNESAEHYREIVVRYMEDELYWQARYWRSKCFMAKGDYDSAIFSLDTMKENSGIDVEKDAILMTLSECYTAKKEYTKAEETLRSLIKNSPDSKWMPSAYCLLADCLQKLGNAEEAKLLYQKIIENYPKSIEAKQAKKNLDSPALIKQDQAKSDKPNISPQLESPFLKASSANKQSTKTQAPKPDKASSSTPPFKVEWKKDEEVKPTEVKTEPSKTEPYFCIQVGAYSKKASADAMADKLQKKNYSVEIIKSTSGENTIS
jgi:TolA-binding protein